jgi:hypothetical protein
MGGSVTNSEVPFVPSSPMELFLTAVLCVVSIVVVAYTMVMLYRCVCSRNYAEWRASWAGDGEGVTSGGTTQVRWDIGEPYGGEGSYYGLLSYKLSGLVQQLYSRLAFSRHFF